MTRLGTVGLLRRYPVKSMLAEELGSVHVTERGLDHDRRLALIDTETGKVVSAKLPRLWEGMLQFQATTEGATVKISCPDGQVIDSADPSVHEHLSALLGKPVRLTATPPEDATFDRLNPEDGQVQLSRAAAGTFFDFGAVHLVTTSTLDILSVPLERYRPNIVVNTSEPGFVENAWVGKQLHIGAQAVLEVIVVTPRCAVPTLAHGSLPRDVRALRVPHELNRIVPLERLGPQPCVGIYARVLQPGTIFPGDAIRL